MLLEVGKECGSEHKKVRVWPYGEHVKEPAGRWSHSVGDELQ